MKNLLKAVLKKDFCFCVVNLNIKQCFIFRPHLLLPLVEYFQKTIYFRTIQTNITEKKKKNTFRQNGEFV